MCKCVFVFHLFSWLPEQSNNGSIPTNWQYKLQSQGSGQALWRVDVPVQGQDCPEGAGAGWAPWLSGPRDWKEAAPCSDPC